jgi:hypothetical protein
VLQGIGEAVERKAGMTQYAVASYGWMLAAWTLVMRIGFKGLRNRIFLDHRDSYSVNATASASSISAFGAKSDMSLRDIASTNNASEMFFKPNNPRDLSCRTKDFAVGWCCSGDGRSV